MTQRLGHWMQTRSGRAFYPLDPRVEDFLIEDIAHALSMTCRFGGHCEAFYSVAQHSVLVMNEVEAMGGGRNARLAALLHDAAEAYVGDVVWPLKQHIGPQGYNAIEDRIQDLIEEAFGIEKGAGYSGLDAQVKTADLVLLATEKRDIMTNAGLDDLAAVTNAARAKLGAWHCDVVAPRARKIEPWSQSLAKDVFLTQFAELKAECAR